MPPVHLDASISIRASARDVLGADLLVWAAVALYLHELGQWALRDLRA
jgi:hypothetical protein